MTNKKNGRIWHIIEISIFMLICFLFGIFLIANYSIFDAHNSMLADGEVEWKVEHYTQKLNFGSVFDEEDYELFDEQSFYNLPNTSQTATPIDIEGFSYDSTNSVATANISDEETTVIKLYYTRNAYVLTVSADSGFDGFLIDGQSLLSTSVLFGQQVEISITPNSHKVLKEYQAFNTDNVEDVFEIDADVFSMPAYNLTVNLISEIEKFSIDIYKVFYENKEDTKTQLFSKLSIPYGSDGSIIIEQSSGYHLFLVGGKYYSSTNNNVSFNSTTYSLSISNVCADDEIFVYFEKDYKHISIFYGTNSDIDNFVGGSALLVEDNKWIFGKTISESVCSAYVYLASDTDAIVEINYLANSGYRFYAVYVVDEANGIDSGCESVEAENGTITLKNIYDNIFIKVLFLKTYSISGTVQKVQIGSSQQQIAKIAFDMESAQNDSAQRIIDEGNSITLNVTINEDYARSYEVKSWIITNDDGDEIDYDDYIIQYQNNLSTITVSEIYRNLNFTAVLDKKIVSVQIAWNGLYGTVESSQTGHDYRYDMEYGSSISFTLKAMDKRHFLKVLNMNETVSELESENVFVRINNSQNNNNQEIDLDENSENFGEIIEFSISNITENITVNVQFVSDTWWEHIETDHGFFGNGTPQIPYIIRNFEDLALLSFYVNTGVQAIPSTIDYDKAYYLVATDLDGGDEYFYIPIGTAEHPFNGTLDYNFFKIENMLIENQALNYKYDGVFYIMGDSGRAINITKNNLVIVFLIISILVIIIATIIIVLFIEKRTKPKKKIITIKEYIARKGGNNLQLSKFGTSANSPPQETNAQEIENSQETPTDDK